MLHKDVCECLSVRYAYTVGCGFSLLKVQKIQVFLLTLLSQGGVPLGH